MNNSATRPSGPCHCQFYNLVCSNYCDAQKEIKLNPKAMITFKRSTTIGQKLTNYKDLALNKTRKQTKGGSRPCEHCALCGFYGKNNKSMVPNVSQLLTKTKTFKLNQCLTCEDFGIYVATCVICHEQCVGQTSNKFSSVKFSSRRQGFSNLTGFWNLKFPCDIFGKTRSFS